MSPIPPTDADAQLSLAGFDPPRASDRLFFAVLPDRPTAVRVQALATGWRQACGLHGRIRPTDHLHVTLHHLGDYAGLPTDKVNRAKAAAAAVHVEPFDMRLDTVGSFAGRRRDLPFVLRGPAEDAGIGGLYRALGQCLAQAGLRSTEHAFVPHITLLYDHQQVPGQAVEPVCWPVGEFVLIHSLLGKTQYRLLGRWALSRHEIR